MLAETQTQTREKYLAGLASEWPDSPARNRNEPKRLDAILDEVLDDIAARGETPNPETESVLRGRMAASVVGFGVLQSYLDDPSVEEIWINRPNEIRFARDGRSLVAEAALPDTEITRLVDRMLRFSGRRIDRTQPFVDAELPDGSRFHCVIPDITRSSYAVNIRKFLSTSRRLGQLVMLEVLTPAQADFLSQAIRSGKNIVVCGATQAGKTTMLAALLAELDDSERVISIEETFELKLANSDWVAMQTRPQAAEGLAEITMRRLVKESLRMRPTRIVVGEVREAECLDLLIALNSGVPGACTIHANSAWDAVEKLCSLPLLAGPNISADFIRQAVGSSIDYVLFCRQVTGGRRRLETILQLDWLGDSRTLDCRVVEVS